MKKDNRINNKKTKEEEKKTNIEISNTENPETDTNTAENSNEETKKSEETVCANEYYELNKKYEELNDRYLRLYSEFDNYRKRTNKEKIELRQHASEDIIKDLLPILDDMDRANKVNSESNDLKGIVEGSLLITTKLKNMLGSRGLSEIDCIGQDFDTDYHEAITTIKAEDPEMKGKIIDETQKGYKLNEKVIRFSKVIIGE
ncbi:MAG: nucleotide exchange factor GrpE [Lentimicrobiaceae bacterium]|nr:nucleotide exchange factor GrpE [Lentimicrobiaceae bacterium]